MAPNLSKSETRTRSNKSGRGSSGASSTQQENNQLNEQRVHELLYEALETETGGIQIYETALRCAQNEDLREEWEKYLEETRNHERILNEVFEKVGLNTDEETPGRRVVRHNGEALVKAMEMALEEGDPDTAQVVAAECIVLAETKDHFNWQLIGAVASQAQGELKEALEDAYEQVERQEDEHLYHTKGWARELRFEAFGMDAQLPPAEEERDVRSQMEAARVQKQRKRTIQRGRTTRRSGSRTRTKSGRSKR